jgi:YHS domain-containing protein
MTTFLKATAALLVASAITLCAEDKASSKMESPSADHSVKVVDQQSADSSKQLAGKPVLVPQTTCPVMGGAINKKLYVDYQGKRIYMCCAGCKSTLAKDPEKYIKKLEAMGQSVEIIDSAKALQSSTGTATPPVKQAAAPKLVPQKTCPVMGNQIDKSVYADYKGKRVYFCCAMCPETFRQDPEKYLKILADKGEAVEEIGKK